MTDWFFDAADAGMDSLPCIVLTVAGVRGSAPREVGARMMVTARDTAGTIGGGQLEYQCVKIAFDQLAMSDERESSTRRFALGSGFGQCCGGVVEVMFEYFENLTSGWIEEAQTLYEQRIPFVSVTPKKELSNKYLVTAERVQSFGGGGTCPGLVLNASRELLATGGPAFCVADHLLEPVGLPDLDVAIFGAGHVGSATVDVLARLDCRIRWIDSRRSLFPDSAPPNVSMIESHEPAREVAAMPSGSYFLIMTHSHPLDFEICDRVLRRDDFHYCGLIGSVSKRRRFVRLMKNQGMTESAIEKLTCPIGVAGIEGKKPVEIAVSIAAEFLQLRDSKVMSGSKPFIGLCSTSELSRSPAK